MSYDEPQKVLEWAATLSCERKKSPECVCRTCMARRIVSGKNDPVQVQETFRQEIARLTAEGKELESRITAAKWTIDRAIQAREEAYAELAEARRRLGLAVKWLRLSDRRAADGELGLMEQITRARDEFRASLPAKPSGGGP